MDVLPAWPAYKMQRGHEWASKTYAACTVAAVHQYITLTVQVTCHWGMVKVLGIRRANQVRGEEGDWKTLHPRGKVCMVYLVYLVCLVFSLNKTKQINQLDRLD
jgi:hypothetical protein